MPQPLKLFVQNLFFAVAYFAGGYLGTLLASAPSNASPIWPASGIALAGLLIKGKKLLPGIVIGALITQIYDYLDTSSVEKIIASVWIGSVIGLGSCLQAYFGSYLIHRFVGPNNPLIEDNKVLSFFLLGGPVSCMVSATIGITLLLLNGIISIHDYAVSWGTWWVGDSIGVLIVTPLLLCYFGEPQKIWQKRWKHIFFPLLALLMVALLVFQFSQQKENAQIMSAFERQVLLFSDKFHDEIQRHIEVNLILRDFFDSHSEVTDAEFKSFTSPIVDRHKDIQALEWIPRVMLQKRQRFENSSLGGTVIRERSENNALAAAKKRDEYYPILYLEPADDTNERAPGYDIGSNPQALMALQAARDHGKTVMSENLWLIQDAKHKPAVVLYTPVYVDSNPGKTLAERRANFKGVIAGVLRIENFLQQAKSRFPDFQLLIELKDGEEILYSDFPKAERHKLEHLQIQLKKSIAIDLADRHWTLTFEPSELFINNHLSWTIWWILLGGLLFTGLMGMGLLILTGRTAYVEQQVDIKTDALQVANQKLSEEIELRRFLENEQNFRYRILEMLSSDASLDKILLGIVSGIENMHPEMLCSILLVDEQGKFLKHGAAPSLPDFYNKAIDGIAIGPGVGSCGTAAFSGERVIVENVFTHPYWQNYKDLVSQTELKACWSQPVFSSKNKILGTFAIYYKEPRAPQQKDLDFIFRMGQLAGIVIEHKRDEEELRIAATTFQSHEAIMITDADGRILRVNRSFSEITGFTEREVIGQNPRILSSGLQKEEFYQNMYRILDTETQWQGELWNKRKNGETFPERLTITAVKDPSGEISHYVAIFSDITDKKVAEKEIQKLAFYDPLTGLPNRRLLLNRLEQEVMSAKRHHHFNSLLYLDLDRFKIINDSLGHHIGDQLLIEVTRRIKNSIRDDDTACRLGGDEFVILMSNRETNIDLARDHAAIFAEKVSDALNQPFVLNGSEYLCSASIGVTLFPESTEQPMAILQQADTAMYRSKAEGRNNIRFFRPSMQEAADQRLLLEKELRTAIKEGQFQLYYQPQVDEMGHIISVEALIRWSHPDKGLIFPTDFIPVTEDTHLILPIGNWVLKNACLDFKAMEKSGLQLHHVAVNVSSKQFRQETFIDEIQLAIEEAGINPNKLMIELTEGVMVDNIEDTITKMLALKNMGVSISIDDFGTGYSSLSYLKKLPLSQLKIDQSFVRDIASNPSDATIVETISEMAKSLGLDVVAEGVENEEQLRFLIEKGCRKFQGHYFGEPVPPEELCSRYIGIKRFE